MSITRDHQDIVFLCDGDGCHESLNTMHSDWGDALADMKTQGWKSSKIAEDWSHFCPDCAEQAWRDRR